jgi:hypothetical protein
MTADAAPAFFHRDLGAFRPASPEAEAMLQKIKLGDVVRIKVERPRNIQHHKKFFALVGLVFRNQDHYQSQEHLLTALKVALGHCDTVICKDGNPAYIPLSISFAKMDQTEFDAFYTRTLDLIAKHFLPGIDKEDLRNEVEGFL